MARAHATSSRWTRDCRSAAATRAAQQRSAVSTRFVGALHACALNYGDNYFARRGVASLLACSAPRRGKELTPRPEVGELASIVLTRRTNRYLYMYTLLSRCARLINSLPPQPFYRYRPASFVVRLFFNWISPALRNHWADDS